MLQKIRWFLLLLGILIIVVVAFQNGESVPLDLLFFRGEYPLTLLLLGTSAASFVFGSLMTFWMLRRRKETAGDAKTAVKQTPKKDRAAAAPPKQADGPDEPRSPLLS